MESVFMKEILKNRSNQFHKVLLK